MASLGAYTHEYCNRVARLWLIGMNSGAPVQWICKHDDGFVLYQQMNPAKIGLHLIHVIDTKYIRYRKCIGIFHSKDLSIPFLTFVVAVLPSMCNIRQIQSNAFEYCSTLYIDVTSVGRFNR